MAIFCSGRTSKKNGENHHALNQERKDEEPTRGLTGTGRTPEGVLPGNEKNQLLRRFGFEGLRHGSKFYRRII